MQKRTISNAITSSSRTFNKERHRPNQRNGINLASLLAHVIAFSKWDRTRGHEKRQQVMSELFALYRDAAGLIANGINESAQSPSQDLLQQILNISVLHHRRKTLSLNPTAALILINNALLSFRALLYPCREFTVFHLQRLDELIRMYDNALSAALDEAAN